jgi:hypothetical protein
MVCRFLLLASMASVLIGCDIGRPPRTCTEIAPPGMRDLLTRPAFPNEAPARIAQAFGVQPSQVDFSPDDEHNGGFGWEKDQAKGGLITHNSQPQVISLIYSARLPPVDTVIHCLGAPDKYRAYYTWGVERYSLQFELYYLARGIFAGAYEFSDSREPPRSGANVGSMGMMYFLFVPTGDPAETMQRLTKDLSPEVIGQLKPWPGKMENVVIEIDPTLRK